MSQSVNFIENAACQHFADFLAEAHELAELTCVQFIGEGYRKVVATIECADDGEQPTSVTITDATDGSVIVQRPTDRA